MADSGSKSRANPFMKLRGGSPNDCDMQRAVGMLATSIPSKDRFQPPECCHRFCTVLCTVIFSSRLFTVHLLEVRFSKKRNGLSSRLNFPSSEKVMCRDGLPIVTIGHTKSFKVFELASFRRRHLRSWCIAIRHEKKLLQPFPNLKFRVSELHGGFCTRETRISFFLLFLRTA